MQNDFINSTIIFYKYRFLNIIKIQRKIDIKRTFCEKKTLIGYSCYLMDTIVFVHVEKSSVFRFISLAKHIVISKKYKTENTYIIFVFLFSMIICL